MLLRNRMYIGIIEVPDFDVREQRGDFEIALSESLLQGLGLYCRAKYR